MVKVKICGLTTPEDVVAVVASGVDAVGINLWPGSLRYVEGHQASEVRAAIPEGVLAIGVFVDAPEAALLRHRQALRLDRLQLHGDEGPALVKRMGAGTIKAFRLAQGSEDGIPPGYPRDEFLVDAHVPGHPGGTGVRTDWPMAARMAVHGRMWLAGGITPANARSAIAAVRPYGLDVASGVELAPGRKDVDAVKRLMEVVRNG